MSETAQQGIQPRAAGRRAGKLASLVLLAAVVLQAVFLTQDYLVPWARDIWQLRDLPAWERSARLSVWIDADDVDFLAFLRQQTPSDEGLVFFGSSGLYSWKALLQYLLFPRAITVCEMRTEPDCLAAAVRAGKFLVVVDGLPTTDSIPSGWPFEPYGGDRGLYRP